MSACFPAVAHCASFPGAPGASDCAKLKQGKRQKAKVENKTRICRPTALSTSKLIENLFLPF
jgi:hypothetical protein